jgi:diketogulonate reductase-like aldo/keto reductase
MEFVTLNNGIKMPKVGFGVFQMADSVQCERAVLEAILAGYRLIDTAAIYKNEEVVGVALKKCDVARDELFITTKLWVQDVGYDETKKAFQTSLDKLGLDYLDLYLIHQPIGDYYGSYRALEELYRSSKIKAIGVSNFYPDRLVDLCLNVDVIPAVNQVELHPFFQQENALSIMKEYHVQPEAWGPLAEGNNRIFIDPILVKIAQKYGKTVAQVVLRWNTQRDVVIIPKSVNKNRIVENIDIWDFELSQKDMNQIALLDLGFSEIVDHRNPEFIKAMKNYRIHE